MVAIVTRAGKGSPLTNAEVDSNFTNLNDGKVENTQAGILAALGFTPANKAGDTFTGDVVFDGKIAAGTAVTASTNYRFGRGLTGGTSASAFVQNGTVQSDVTTTAVSFNSQTNTAPAAFTLTNYFHYYAQQGVVGAGSAITAITGFYADSTLTGSTNTYGFRGAVGSGSGRWNLFMDGGANNHVAGAFLVGTTAAGASNVRSARNVGGGVSAFNFLSDGFVQSDVTSTAVSYRSALNTAAASFTLSTLTHFQAAQGNIGAGSTVTTQEGFRADSSMVGAGSNIGFRGAIPSGANRWNLFMDGTAANFLAGATILNNALGFGSSSSPSYGTSGQLLKSGGSGAVPTWAALTSGEVTTALGFTPYNATNPSAYIDTNGTARTIVENNGSVVGARRALNFIPGTGISLSIADDSANEEVDITITSTVTGGVTSFNTRTGAVTLSSSDVTTALGFTPYNSANPSGYITSASLSSYLPLSGGTLTGFLTINADMRVGNGAAASYIYMADSDNGERIIHNNSDRIGFLTQAGGWGAWCDDSGNWQATGNVTANSDERLKKDWTGLPNNFVDRLALVKSGTYTRIDTGERQAGSSAQDWQALLPEVVQVGPDDAKTLSLAYGNAALVAVVELAKRLLAIDERLERIEKEMGA